MPEYIREVSLTESEVISMTEASQNFESRNTMCYFEDGDRKMCTGIYRICPCSYLGSNNGIWETSLISCYSAETSSEISDNCFAITAESNGYSLHLSSASLRKN